MSSDIFTYIPQPESLSQVRQDISVLLQQAGWQDRQMDISLAIGEVLQNIIRYGFAGGSNEGHIQIELSLSNDRLSFVITDNAPPSDPSGWVTTHRPPEDGGLGLNLIDALADEVRYTMLSAGNQAELSFYKAQAAPA